MSCQRLLPAVPATVLRFLMCRSAQSALGRCCSEDWSIELAQSSMRPKPPAQRAACEAKAAHSPYRSESTPETCVSRERPAEAYPERQKLNRAHCEQGKHAGLREAVIRKHAGLEARWLLLRTVGSSTRHSEPHASSRPNTTPLADAGAAFVSSEAATGIQIRTHTRQQAAAKGGASSDHEFSRIVRIMPTAMVPRGSTAHRAIAL